MRFNIRNIYLKYLSPMLLLINNIQVEAKTLIMEGKVKIDIVNVREKSENDSNIIFSIKKDSIVEIIGESKDKNWFEVKQFERKGWVPKSVLVEEDHNKYNYKNVSTIGNIRDTGIIFNTVKMTQSKNYKIILDYNNKFFLRFFTKDNVFIKSIPIIYPWVHSNDNVKNIVLTCDDDGNYFTNDIESKNLSVYNLAGEHINTINDIGLPLKALYDFSTKEVYILDSLSKSIKAFNSLGENTKNIFLSETKIPKSFSVSNNKAYVIDSELNDKDNYSVYYVNSFSFSLKRDTQKNSETIETISKGTILGNVNNKIVKTKEVDDKDPNNSKDTEWVDFSDNKKKKFADLNDLKKVSIKNGEIDIYKLSGEPSGKITLNQRWDLISLDRHRSTNKKELTREILDIHTDNKEKIVLQVLSKSNNDVYGLNYYYLDPFSLSYKISQSVEGNNLSTFSYFNGEISSANFKGYLSILNENGIEYSSLGRISHYKLNYPYKLHFNNNNLFVLDKATSGLLNYDVNGELLKSKYGEQGLFFSDYTDVFWGNSKIYLIKTIDLEERKSALEIYDYKFNKLLDKILFSSTGNVESKITVNEKGNIFITGEFDISGKKHFMVMINNKGHIINKWKAETDLASLYPEEDLKKTKDKSFKFLSFDNNGRAYILFSDRNNIYKIHCINITELGKAEIIKSLDLTMFETISTFIDGDKTYDKREFSGTISGQILAIREGKNKYIYILYRDTTNKTTKICIHSPIGVLKKEVYLNEYEDVRDMTLDSQDNIWLTTDSSLRKISNN